MGRSGRKTIFDEIHDRVPHATIGYVRNLLGAFLFSGDDVYKKISVLSGGEKSRVVLATLLANPVNVLVLDEPTNHLDIRSREILPESSQKFEGTVGRSEPTKAAMTTIPLRSYRVK